MGGLGEREGSDDEVEEEEIRVWDLGEEKMGVVKSVAVGGGEERDEWCHEEWVVVAPCDHHLGVDLKRLVNGSA